MRTIIRNNYTPQTGDYCNTIVIDELNSKQWIFDRDGVFTDITGGAGASVTNVLGQSTTLATSQKLVTDELDKKVDKTIGIVQTDWVVGMAGVDSFIVNKDYIDLADGAVSTKQMQLPLASAFASGIMPAAAYMQIETNTQRIAALETGDPVNFVVTFPSATPTQAQLQALYESVSGRTTPIDGTRLFDPALNLTAIWFQSSSQWVVTGGTGMPPLATQTSVGVVMGSMNNGQVFVESDGTMSVNGFDKLGILYPSTGQNTDGAMTQKATTDMVFDPDIATAVRIGSTVLSGTNTVSVGYGARATAGRGVALGDSAIATNAYSVALGSRSTTNRASEISVGTGTADANVGTRYVANVRDPALPQDAATKAYVDASSSEGGLVTVTTTGTASNYVVTSPDIPTPIPNGYIFTMIPNVNGNSTSNTLNVNGAGVAQIRIPGYGATTSGTSSVPATAFLVGRPLTVRWDATGDHWLIIGGVSGTIAVANGGTGRTSQTARTPIIGGTSTTSAQRSMPVPVAPAVVAMDSASTDPYFLEMTNFVMTESAVDTATGVVYTALAKAVVVETNDEAVALSEQHSDWLVISTEGA